MGEDAEDKLEQPEQGAAEAPLEQKADPELLRQLQESEDRAASDTTAEPVQAVFVLGGPADTGASTGSGRSDGSLPSPEETEKMVERVIERVQAETGKRVELLNVFRYLNSFLVSGDPVAIRSLLEQPEIASAVANRQPGKVELLREPGPTPS